MKAFDKRLSALEAGALVPSGQVHCVDVDSAIFPTKAEQEAEADRQLAAAGIHRSEEDVLILRVIVDPPARPAA